MEFRHLRYFLVLAEELHFGRAARRLSISQPPLSLNIQQLEASVGARLFTRSSKAVSLTAAGMAFVPAARALLEQSSRAANLARDVGRGMAGNLTIGFAGTLLYSGLPGILARFQAQHPLLRVVLKEMSSSEQLIELTQDRLDVGFVHTSRVPPELSQILVARQAFVACLPVAHALAGQHELPLQRLDSQPFAVISRTVSPDYHDRILAACARAGFLPEIRFELQHWLSVVALVSRGMGVALVPKAMSLSAMSGAVCIPLAGLSEPDPYETHCLWKTSRQMREDRSALTGFLEAVQSAPDLPASMEQLADAGNDKKPKRQSSG